MCKKVELKYSVVQVKDGTEYKGEITIGKKTLAYVVTFTNSIADLDAGKVAGPKVPDDYRKYFVFTIHDGEKMMEIGDRQYEFLVGLLVTSITLFYRSPQTRASNGDGLMGATLRNAGFKDTGLDIDYSLRIDTTTTLNVSTFGQEVLASMGFEL